MGQIGEVADDTQDTYNRHNTPPKPTWLSSMPSTQKVVVRTTRVKQPTCTSSPCPDWMP